MATALEAGDAGRSPGDIADALDASLARATEKLAVRRPKNDRFELYARRLREAAAASYPGPLPWSDAGKRAQFHEALSQCPAMTRALALDDVADVRVLRAMLEKALGGPALPLPSAVDDEARNALFELATAALLRAAGFRVSLEPAGTTASISPLPSFAVECARVGDDWSWTEGVRRMAARLDRRADGRTLLGLPIVGRDALQGESRHLRGFDSLEQLERAVRATLNEGVRRAREELRRRGLAVRASCPAVLLVLSTQVLLKDRGLFGHVAQVMPFPLGDTVDPSAARVLSVLASRPFRV